jgi:hypothetical protein
VEALKRQRGGASALAIAIGSVRRPLSVPSSLSSAARKYQAHNSALHTRRLLRLDECVCIGNLPVGFVPSKKKRPQKNRKTVEILWQN